MRFAELRFRKRGRKIANRAAATATALRAEAARFRASAAKARETLGTTEEQEQVDSLAMILTGRRSDDTPGRMDARADQMFKDADTLDLLARSVDKHRMYPLSIEELAFLRF